MNLTKLATSALAALAVAVAAGCGGDGESGALSKAQYTEQGNKLCRDAVDAANEVEPPRSAEEIADYVDRLFEVSFGYVDDFEALEPPEELRGAHEESVRLSKDSRQLVEDLVERLRAAKSPQTALPREFQELAATKEFRRSQEVTRELGLDDCLDLGAPGAESRGS